MNISNLRFLAVLYMILSMVAYQISASFAKQLIVQLDPLTVTILRLCFAAILVTIMFRSWRILSQLSSIKWRDLLLYSACLGSMNILFYSSLGKLPQGIAVGLEFIGPLALAFFSIQQRSDYVWVILAILGIAFMVPWQEAATHHFSYIGAAYALGAGLFWAGYIYFGHRVAQKQLGMHALTIAITLSALVLLPIGLAQNSHTLLDTQYWGKALIIALLATAIPYTLDLMALKHLSKLSYGTLSSLAPALAAIAGLVILKEYLYLMQWVALICICIASVGVTLRADQTKT